MTETDLKLYEFVKSLRLQADEYQEAALNNRGSSLEVKLCGMMYAYREIADKIEKKFRDNE